MNDFLVSRPRWLRTLSRMTVGLLLLTVAACSSIENWEEVQPQRQPSVRSVDHHHTVSFPGRSTSLSREAQREIDVFLSSIGADPANHVAIAPRERDPAGISRTGMARAQAVSRYLRRRGFDPKIVTTVAPPAATVGGIDIAVRQFSVSLPRCPDWSDRPGWNFNNLTSSNWGCATANNLGVMVADPADLVRGAGGQPAMAEPLALSIDRYRRDEIKELEAQATTTVLPAEGGGGE